MASIVKSAADLANDEEILPLSTADSSELDTADARYRRNFAKLFQRKTGRLRQATVRDNGPIKDFSNVTFSAGSSLLPDSIPLIIIDDAWDHTDIQQWRMQTGKNL